MNYVLFSDIPMSEIKVLKRPCMTAQQEEEFVSCATDHIYYVSG